MKKDEQLDNETIILVKSLLSQLQMTFWELNKK